jgi:hypothetical protein
MVFFRMCFCGPFCGPFCATESTEKVFSVHKNTLSVLSVAQNCADTKTEGTSEKVFGCGAHSFDVIRRSEVGTRSWLRGLPLRASFL